MKNTFTLSFKDKIGGKVILSEDGEYYMGEHISGRFYSGIFNGSFYKSDGIYFKVNNDLIKINTNTKITFDE